MDELKVILSHEMDSSISDYKYYLQCHRIDLRLGMSTQVMSFLKAIVNDFERLDQWLLSVENQGWVHPQYPTWPKLIIEIQSPCRPQLVGRVIFYVE